MRDGILNITAESDGVANGQSAAKSIKTPKNPMGKPTGIAIIFDPFGFKNGPDSGAFVAGKGFSLGIEKGSWENKSNAFKVHAGRRFDPMLTKIDVENIRSLKEKGYSRRRTARELGLNPKTVGRYWPESVKSHRLEDYFFWQCCDACGIEYPHPKFLPIWHCPGCRKQVSSVKCWYPPSSRILKGS
jgi:hypothetical protein